MLLGWLLIFDQIIPLMLTPLGVTPLDFTALD
jgi:hypothetical protein